MRGPDEVDRVLDALMARKWVVFSKPCLARTETVVDYLGRYSHRIALSDWRLSDFDGTSVRLAYKDYRDGNRRKSMVVQAEELIRRFLLHVLPGGFMRVRHFGFLANRCRAKRLAQIRTLLDAPTPTAEQSDEEPSDPWCCPRCANGHLHRVADIPRPRPWMRETKRKPGAPRLFR